MTDFGTHEFAADFLEEADQHVGILIHELLAIEQRGHGRESVDVLFRSFHTMKGLCGMVGLQTATELSHQAESVLTRVRRHQLDMSTEVVDTLLSVAQAIEQQVQAWRTPGQSAPVVDALLERLAGLLQDAPADLPQLAASLARSLTAENREEIGGRLKQGAVLSVCTFTPSAERAAGQITVNSVRQELALHAFIAKAVPLASGAGVTFAFLLLSVQPLEPSQFPAVTWHPGVTAGELGLEGPSVADSPPVSRHVTSVRVDIPRLDELMHLTGELVTSRYRLEAWRDQGNDGLNETLNRLGRQVKALREAVTRLRLVPVAEVFSRMPLTVRDLARSLNTQVDLRVEGESAQVDKALVERLLDPLLHLVRNAVSHGLEPAADRVAAGKAATGTVLLNADSTRDTLLIRVHDDGRGLDRPAIARRARQLGWWTDSEEPDLPAVLAILCRPGFSTRTGADLGAGRGVGLDVVLQSVRAMGGTLSVETVPGQSTTFTLKLPLSLAIMDAMLVESGRELYAVPRSEVETVVEMQRHDIVTAPEGQLVPFLKGAVPLFSLARLFDIPGGDSMPRFYALLSGEAGRLSALAVDRLVGMQEVVVRSLADPLLAQPGLAGVTELGSGRTALLLNMADLIRYAGVRS
ncbi:MAG TPA: chemotaxis protein CheA [Candidatus Xenobia bacterium]